MNRKQAIALLVVTCAVGLAIGVIGPGAFGPGPGPGVGKPAPHFYTKTLDGGAVSFPDDFKGKIVLLDFWATWCGPCMGEAPNVVAAYRQFHDQGFEILGVSLDQAGDAQKVRGVTAQLGMAWPQIYEGKEWQSEFGALYGVNSIPAAFLVDGDSGAILASGRELRGAGLARAIRAALDRKSGQPAAPDGGHKPKIVALLN